MQSKRIFTFMNSGNLLFFYDDHITSVVPFNLIDL